MRGGYISDRDPNKTSRAEKWGIIMDEQDYNDLDRTQEMDSIEQGSASSRGITPRGEFTELNSADMDKTLRMDSISDDEYRTDSYTGDGEYPYEDGRYSAPNPVKRRRKKKRRINHTRTMAQVFLGVLISVAATCLGIALSVQVITAIRDITGMAKQKITREVEISDSMNTDDIVDLLHEEGLIQMPWLMKAYIHYSDEEEGFLNGSFEVSSNMSYSTLISALKSVKQYTETVTVMIPEGSTAQQIGALLEENYVCRAEDFEKFYREKLDKYDFEEQINADPNRFYALEGYLFPDTYEFYVIDDMKKNPDFDTEQYAKSAAEKMFGNFEDKLTRSMLERMEELGMSIDETIILASLIQKEGTNEENMSMISSVFHNRMNNSEIFPMLQSDTTYTYIEDCIEPVLSGERLTEVSDAYDTYKCEGLPAGAVCNPGVEAITAALYPADSDYFYFLCSEDGVFYYAQTEEQHNQNIIDAELRGE